MSGFFVVRFCLPFRIFVVLNKRLSDSVNAGRWHCDECIDRRKIRLPKYERAGNNLGNLDTDQYPSIYAASVFRMKYVVFGRLEVDKHYEQ